MKNKPTMHRIGLCLSLLALCSVMTAYAAQKKYKVHDMTRPLPPVVVPDEKSDQPPSDATVLLDGVDTSKLASDKGGSFKWTVKDGYMEVASKAGGIHTVDSFGSCQLHVEWATPADFNPKVKGQSRSNSGIFFMGRYELQILDSYTDSDYANNRTYADGQAASLYGQHPPIVNACRKPGQWQSYDVSFLRPIFDENGKCIRPARITVFHNGVVVHNNVEIQGSTAHKRKARYSPHPDKLPIRIQDHGNPIRFRNIWIRELPEQPYLIAD